jgi:hypothetical protein
MRYDRTRSCCTTERTYDNYWKYQQGKTVCITRGALAGRSGRLGMVAFKYGEVLLATDGPKVLVVYTDLVVRD